MTFVMVYPACRVRANETHHILERKASNNKTGANNNFQAYSQSHRKNVLHFEQNGSPGTVGPLPPIPSGHIGDWLFEPLLRACFSPPLLSTALLEGDLGVVVPTLSVPKTERRSRDRGGKKLWVVKRVTSTPPPSFFLTNVSVQLRTTSFSSFWGVLRKFSSARIESSLYAD